MAMNEQMSMYGSVHISLICSFLFFFSYCKPKMCVRFFIFVFSFPPIHESIAKRFSVLFPPYRFGYALCPHTIKFRDTYTPICIYTEILSHTYMQLCMNHTICACACVDVFVHFTTFGCVFFFFFIGSFFPSTVVVKTLTYINSFTSCIPHTHTWAVFHFEILFLL